MLSFTEMKILLLKIITVIPGRILRVLVFSITIRPLYPNIGKTDLVFGKTNW